jgi:DNA-binding transcriptional ArsR family regulator
MVGESWLTMRHDGSVVKVVKAELDEQVEAAIAVFGTTTRVGILRYLLKDGPAQTGAITKDLEFTRITVIKAVAALEQLGVIAADIPPDQRRGKRVMYRADRVRIEELLNALRGALDFT